MDISISNVDFMMVVLSVLAYAAAAAIWTYVVVPPMKKQVIPASDNLATTNIKNVFGERT